MPQVGDRISARFTDGKWYTATVQAVLAKGQRFAVRFLDYGDTATVQADCIRPFQMLAASDLSVGQQVRAIFSGDGLFYDAVITAFLPNERYSALSSVG